MTESDRLIEETLRLDAEAKAARQVALAATGDDAIKAAYMAERQARWNCTDEYQYSAPRLARMLKMHQELTNGIVNGTQPPWLDEAKKLKETRPYESLESKAARYVLNKCDEIAKGEA
mgnify:CR=1 FL=1